MAKPSSTIISLIEAGAHVSVIASDYPPATLVSMAEAAARNNTQFTIREAGEKVVESLLSIVKAGKGNVTLIF